MGLDMYLSLRKSEYTSKLLPDQTGKLRLEYPEAILEDFPEFARAPKPEVPGGYVSDPRAVTRKTDYRIGYWRKANAIHNWIVRNLTKDFNDETHDICQDIEVDLSDAKALLCAVEEVLADHSKAAAILPTTDGFFFGSTEYDEWYFDNLEHTKEVLEPAIAFLEKIQKRFEGADWSQIDTSDEEVDKYLGWSLIYRASW